MDYTDFIAKKDDSGRKLSKILSSILEGTKAKPFEIIRKNLVKLNDKKIKTDCQINENDKISVASFLLSEKKTDINSLKKTDDSLLNNKKIQAKIKFSSLEVIFKNENLLVINKPRGINVQQGSADSLNLAAIVLEEYKLRHTSSLSFEPGPLHRIDKNTSGLLCFSQSLSGARWFSENINSHKITKIYAGIAEGKITENQRWEDYLCDDNSSEGFHKVRKATSEEISQNQGKKCITNVFPVKSVIISGKEYTVCLYNIETGRKHQIRCMSAIHNHALAGDTAYNAKKLAVNGKIFNSFILHAYILKFPENELGIPQIIKAPLPQEFTTFINPDLLNQYAESII